MEQPTELVGVKDRVRWWLAETLLGKRSVRLIEKNALWMASTAELVRELSGRNDALFVYARCKLSRNRAKIETHRMGDCSAMDHHLASRMLDQWRAARAAGTGTEGGGDGVAVESGV